VRLLQIETTDLLEGQRRELLSEIGFLSAIAIRMVFGAQRQFGNCSIVHRFFYLPFHVFACTYNVEVVQSNTYHLQALICVASVDKIDSTSIVCNPH